MLIGAGMLGTSAMAQQLPRFNVEATCKAAQPLSAEDTSPYDSCMRDETGAERQLQGTWSSADPALRERCARESQIEGTPSYVDMLTCLQIAQGTTPTVQRRKRAGQ
jgi:hypothetical protein